MYTCNTTVLCITHDLRLNGKTSAPFTIELILLISRGRSSSFNFCRKQTTVVFNLEKTIFSYLHFSNVHPTLKMLNFTIGLLILFLMLILPSFFIIVVTFKNIPCSKNIFSYRFLISFLMLILKVLCFKGVTLKYIPCSKWIYLVTLILRICLLK